MCSFVIETSSVLPEKSSLISEIFRNPPKCSEMSGRDYLNFAQLLENLPKSYESARKSLENRPKTRHEFVYIEKG